MKDSCCFCQGKLKLEALKRKNRSSALLGNPAFSRANPVTRDDLPAGKKAVPKIVIAPVMAQLNQPQIKA